MARNRSSRAKPKSQHKKRRVSENSKKFWLAGYQEQDQKKKFLDERYLYTEVWGRDGHRDGFDIYRTPVEKGQTPGKRL